jgi:hypothetical protein
MIYNNPKLGMMQKTIFNLVATQWCIHKMDYIPDGKNEPHVGTATYNILIPQSLNKNQNI